MTTREHKFRAWDTGKKVMYSAEELGADQETLSVDGRGFVNVSGDNTKLSQFHTHLLPLEYTGLKDKNGVEIYEGDIMKSAGGRIREVYWDNELSQYRFRSGADMFHADMMEVIGNIYENPELIKKGE